MAMQGRRHGTRSGEHGQAALEFVLVLSSVFIMVFFAAEGAIVVKSWMMLESASREAARCGVFPGETTAQIQTCASNIYSSSCNGPLTNCQASVTYPNGQSVGNPVKVTVTGTYSFAPSTDLLGSYLKLIGVGGLTSISMAAQTQMRIEEQTS
jgi:Flp pilus assembly protein TadG